MAGKKFVNYRQLFSVQNEIAKVIKQACPQIDNESGIYFLIREDTEKNEKYAYIGKGVDLLRRMVSHVQGYEQQIDKSLKKRGFYHPTENWGGWKLNVLHFREFQLDEKEAYYIDKYRNAGYIMYNVESGGTIGKTMINERKGPKTYTEGLSNGRYKAIGEVKEYFDKYLDYQIKPPITKIKERKITQFGELLNSNKKDGTN